TTSNNNAFNHTTLRTLVDWINTDSGSSSNHFANTTFDIPANGSITIVPNVTAGASTNVSRANLYIAWNKSYLNSASLTFLNVSGQILLRNITFADPGSTVDYDDDGTFAQCATCTEVNFFQGVFTYNITSFTAYSSNEANLPPAVTIVTPANNSTATNSTPTVSVRIIDTIDSNVSVTIFANGSNKSYNGTVINGTETIMAWSSTADGIYYYYASARDPLGNVNVSDGNSTLIIDTTVPNITQTPNSDSSNNTTVNRTWQFFNFSIVDNTYLANTSFELTSAQNGSTVNYSLTKGGTSYNYTINLTNAVEGNYSYRVYANDSAGNQRRFINNWFFVDLEATTIENIFHKPNDTNDLDPNNTLVNVTADVIDSSQNISGGGIHSVVLEFSTNGTTIHNTTMLNVSGNTKWGNFTSNATGNWTYRIFANDTAGKSPVSPNTTISVAYDYTWTLSPTNITTTSAAIGNNITMVNITLNNTGDYSQIFVIAKDIAVVPIVTLNQTTANLSQGRQTMIQVNVTPPTTAGTYDMSIKFTANNSTQSTATPQVNYSNGTFISRGDGPFLYLTIDSANASVARGDTYYINVKVVNYGNETANSAWVAYSVPSGWTATNDSLGSVGPNETTTWSNVTFAVPASADTGAQAILAYVGFQNYKHNQTSNASTSVSVTSSGTTTTTTTTSGGGGGAGGGGGGGSGGLSEAQKAALFGTPKVYDLVSGKDKVFPFVVGNPYAGSEMHNVSIEVTGLLSQYLRVEPKFVAKIPKDGSYPTKIIITAPAYFTEGEHELTFTIKSTVIKGVVRTKATETTKVVLRVHEISTDDAKELIGDTAGLIAKLQKAGFYSKGIEALLKKAQAGFESGDYKSVSELSKDAQQLVDNAFASDKGIKSLGPQVEGAGNLGARVSESARLLNLAKAAFARGDFNTAAERIKEAELTYLVETKGYFNFAYFIRSNFRNILLSTVAAILLSVGTYFYGTYAYLSHNLRGSQREEDILLGLMKTIQRECFEEKKMSMSEYGEAMFQYERKLNKVVQKIVELESKKANLLKFGHEDQQLKHEAARIMELIKETQKKYMEKGDLETRIYEDKMKGFTARLGEVEERIASLEAIKAVRENKGVFGKLMIWLTKAVGEEEKE
ncbi:TPA: hypothetical protein H1009_00040, partial [archaeon]|nr:hypothetical protein [Candidatus Naiadarchaeales archaeon SRR2090153.bin461]